MSKGGSSISSKDVPSGLCRKRRQEFLSNARGGKTGNLCAPEDSQEERH